MAALMIGCVVLLFLQSLRLAPARRARQQAIAALCNQRGFLPGVIGSDYELLGAIAPSWLTNSYSLNGVGIADFTRPVGKTTEYFSVLVFTVAGVNMPHVSVTRHGQGLTIGGPPSVEMESIDFDQRFTVRAKDRRSAVMLLDPGMMQLLLDSELVNFSMVGDRVVAYIDREAEPSHQAGEPVEFVKLFRFLDGFLPRVPELLRTEYAAAN